MAEKKVVLALPKNVYDALKKSANSGFMTVEQLISDILRRSVLAKKKAGKSKKVDEPFLEYFSRKK